MTTILGASARHFRQMQQECESLTQERNKLIQAVADHVTVRAEQHQRIQELKELNDKRLGEIQTTLRLLAEARREAAEAQAWMTSVQTDILGRIAHLPISFGRCARDWLAVKTPQVALTAAINDEKLNPWKRAIIDALVCGHILKAEHESDPVLALKDLICWEHKIALDPAVSKEARELIVQYREDAERWNYARKELSWIEAGGWDGFVRWSMYLKMSAPDIRATSTDECVPSLLDAAIDKARSKS